MTVTLVFWADDTKWFKIYVNGHYVCEILSVNREHAFMKAHHERDVKKFLKQQGIENSYMLVCKAVEDTEAEIVTPDKPLLHQLAKRVVQSPSLSRIFKGKKGKEHVGS